MKYTPYDYQRKAIDFIKEHPSAALLLDMGLGKTVITLTAFHELRDEGRVSKLLVVAPKRVAEMTWPNEILEWDHLQDLTISRIRGTAAQRRKAMAADADIYTISRDNVKWYSQEKNTPKCDMLAIDEMSSFKNAESARTKAMIDLRPRFSRAVGLTGTPAPNNWLNLWGQYRIVDNGTVFGKNFFSFRNSHFRPGKMIHTKNGLDVPVTYNIIPGHEEILSDRIRPITLSMKSFGRIKLPGISFSQVYAEMTPQERKQYEDLASNLKGYVGNEKMQIPTDEALVGKLVQLANGSVYGEKQSVIDFHSHKLDVLFDILEDNPTKNMLVVYWFRSDFDRITRALAKAGIPFADLADDKAIEMWNKRKLRVGLIHPAKAGHGLNLQKGGSMVVWYTLWWDLELYEQTNARLYRNGQTEHVSIVHIMTKDTIDDAIYGAIKRKMTIQEKLFEKTSEEYNEEEHDSNESENLLDNLFVETGNEEEEPMTEGNRNCFLYMPDDKDAQLPSVMRWLGKSRKSRWTDAWNSEMSGYVSEYSTG